MWVGIVRLVFRMTRTYTYAHTRTHITTVRIIAVAKRRPRSSAAVVPWLPQRQNVNGVIQVNSSEGRQSSKREREKY